MSEVILKTVIIMIIAITGILMLIATYLKLADTNRGIDRDIFFAWCLGSLSCATLISLLFVFIMCSNKQEIKERIEEKENPVSVNYIIYNYKEYINAGIYINGEKLSIDDVTFNETNGEKKIFIKN